MLARLLAFNPFRGRLAGPEDALAIEIGSQLRAWSLEGRLDATWSHLPHEVGGRGSSAKVRMALAKAMGLIPGSGDYAFVWLDGGGWIELKSKDGSLSLAQRDFRQWCADRGVRYEVCRSVEAVAATLRDWGVLR